MEPRHREVREWLTKGWRDLLSARVLSARETLVADTAVFHCQQAVEKALKAFLVYHERTFSKVHNLGYLLDLCASVDASVERLRDRCDELTPYGVGARYPGEIEDITPEQAKRALDCAEYAWACIVERLPADTHATL